MRCVISNGGTRRNLRWSKKQLSPMFFVTEIDDF